MKPMLSATCDDINALMFPKVAGPKLDGIRCLIVEGRAVTRNFKAVPNFSIYEKLSHDGLTGLDGEIIVGDPKAPDCYRRTNSGVMSHEGAPDWTFWVFDDFTNPTHGFTWRLRDAKSRIAGLSGEMKKRVKLVPHIMKGDAAELAEYEAQHIIAGFEGVMVRDPSGPYKFGRATVKEGWLMKIKRFTDSEYLVSGVVEQLLNLNEQTRDELGRGKRSSHRENKIGKNTMGALNGVDVVSGVEFDVGTGFTDAQRQDIWDNWPRDLGTVRKYKSLAVGVKDKPRHPVDLGPRLDI